jgi:adenylate cyclase
MEASMSFWKELSRRNVVKVGIAYAVAAWLIIHPVDIIFPILNLPKWSITLVTAILIILFPLVLIFSWAYEITPKGLKKTKEVPISKSITHVTGRRLNYIIIGLLVIALGYFVFDKYYMHGAVTTPAPAVTTSVPVASTPAKAKKSIAVLPFSNMSGDKEQESFADGLSEEMINTITQIPDLRVIARTSSFTFKDSDKKVQDIAKELNVEYILEGSVRKAGNELRITAQLISAADESHLWSKTYDKELKDIFTIQEDIAAAVASELKATLGIGKSLKQLGGTDNEKAYELYLVVKGMSEIDPKRALELIDEAIAIDPEFALAWTAKSRAYIQLANMLPIYQRAEQLSAALNAAQKAIKLEPNLADAFVALGNYKMTIGDFIDAELAVSKASELKNEPLWTFGSEFSLFYLAVGNFEKAHEIIDKARTNDPLNPILRGAIILYYGIVGDRQRAEEAYERELELNPNDWANPFFITLTRLSAKESISSDQIPEISYLDPIWHNIKENLENPQDGIVVLHRFYDNNNNLNSYALVGISMWAAYFDDPKFSLEVLEKNVKLEAVSVFYIWSPLYKKVRQLPRFKGFVKKIGLVDYWNKFGWPDMCHKLDNGDFECD